MVLSGSQKLEANILGQNQNVHKVAASSGPREVASNPCFSQFLEAASFAWIVALSFQSLF